MPQTDRPTPASTRVTVGSEDLERLEMVLSYQTGLAGRTIGLPQEQSWELAQAVVRAVRALVEEWARQQTEDSDG
ncbi:hypothetical protein [Streptomyces spiralis]